MNYYMSYNMRGAPNKMYNQGYKNKRQEFYSGSGYGGRNYGKNKRQQVSSGNYGNYSPYLQAGTQLVGTPGQSLTGIGSYYQTAGQAPVTQEPGMSVAQDGSQMQSGGVGGGNQAGQDSYNWQDLDLTGIGPNTSNSYSRSSSSSRSYFDPTAKEHLDQILPMMASLQGYLPGFMDRAALLPDDYRRWAEGEIGRVDDWEQAYGDEAMGIARERAKRYRMDLDDVTGNIRAANNAAVGRGVSAGTNMDRVLAGLHGQTADKVTRERLAGYDRAEQDVLEANKAAQAARLAISQMGQQGYGQAIGQNVNNATNLQQLYANMIANSKLQSGGSSSISESQSIDYSPYYSFLLNTM